MTAEEASALLQELGFPEAHRAWDVSGALPACPATACPMPGSRASEEGCLSIYPLGVSSSSPVAANQQANIGASWHAAGDVAASFTDILFISPEVRSRLQTETDRRCLELQHIPVPDRIRPYIPEISYLEPTQWRLVEEPIDSELHIRIAIGGSCEQLGRIDVVETEQSVTVTALRRHTNPGPAGACTGELKVEFATVQLQSPLGDRRLYGCDPADEPVYLGEHVPDGECASAIRR